jgi:CheY-like chemotaxis protein
MVDKFVGNNPTIETGEAIVHDPTQPDPPRDHVPRYDPPQPTVVCLEADLLVATRLQDVIVAQGGQAVITETPEAFVDAVDLYFPVLTLLDLNTPGDWKMAIMRCKMRPQSRQIPIYAFGSHVDVDALKAARVAGADHAWARSRMMEELVTVVEQHINPPIQYLEGWDDRLSDLARTGLLEFNHGEYFEQHEHLEHAWLAEPRPIRAMYQGILQVGVAFLLIQRGNWMGALKMFRRALPRLRPLPPVCQGVNIAALRTAAEAIHAEIMHLGAVRLSEFDQGRFPKIEFESTPSQPPPRTGEEFLAPPPYAGEVGRG